MCDFCGISQRPQTRGRNDDDTYDDRSVDLNSKVVNCKRVNLFTSLKTINLKMTLKNISYVLIKNTKLSKTYLGNNGTNCSSELSQLIIWRGP